MIGCLWGYVRCDLCDAVCECVLWRAAQAQAVGGAPGARWPTERHQTRVDDATLEG